MWPALRRPAWSLAGRPSRSRATIPNVNLFDLIAILLIAVAGIAGFRSGALPQLGGLGGALVAIAVGLTVLPALQDPLLGLDPLPRAILILVGILVGIAVGEGIGASIGHRLGSGLGDGLIGAFDHVAGAIVGGIQAVLVIWLVGGLLALSTAPRLVDLASGSAAIRVLDGVLPPPANFVGQVARVLDDSGLPDLFVGLEPIPAPPVRMPSDPEARRIGELAMASTVKVTSPACGLILTGTGVVISKGYVVTNAHVVAGTRSSRVVLDGTTFDAVTVMFDPELDVALLQVPRLTAPTMRFAAQDPGRGATGAALGFPGGGALTIIAAAVTQQLQATGRDIYGQALVERRILELQAPIQQGDSGGPFVLPDGTIGGLVFAQARSTSNVGYALAPTAVATRVAPAIGRTNPVDMGTCTR
jgi:S1-C subfamily serine protease